MDAAFDIMTATDEQIMAAVEPPANATSVASPEETTPTEGEDSTDPTSTEDTPADESDTPDETEGDGTEEESEEDTTETDSAAAEQLKKIFAPFSANGKEIQVDNVDDAIRLMQMGAGFNKKMAALKPHLKLMKMLENNGLLDEGKLSFLIDVNKKNPDAISKLLAESNIDPLNLNLSNQYTPNTYTVTESELELDDVVADLKESPHYSQTLDVVVNKWDDTSKKLLVSNPPIIRILHEQIANGIYAQVTQVVERERLLGRLNGLSDLEAYKKVGDDMDAKGLFAKPADKAKAPPATQAPGATDESKLKSRRLAASPTKTSPAAAKGTFNPLAMTDEEIMNTSLDKFL